MTQNLIEGLVRELNRCKDVLKIYEEISEGKFGAAMIKQSITTAEKAMVEGDTVAMISSLKDLKSIE